MGSCAAPSAKGDDKFITTDYLQQCQKSYTAVIKGKSFELLRLKEGNGRLHIPDEQATWLVAYSDELSNSDVANPEHFLTAYQNQQAPQ